MQRLRQQGKTYAEIQKMLGKKISKSTLSSWCKNISLNLKQRQRITSLIQRNTRQAQKKAVNAQHERRLKYLALLANNNARLPSLLKKTAVAKIVLATLYAAEGTKGDRGSLTFGNSDPLLIKLFLRLLRACYPILERKFRCTLQCRADSNIRALERFWRHTTKIPRKQFYRARIDPRSIGKKTQKKNYRGVCRLDYFSAHIYNELIIIMKLLTKI